MSTRRSTNRRSRYLSRSTLRLDIAHAPLFVSLRKHLARRIDDRVNAAGKFDRPGDIQVKGAGAEALQATAAGRRGRMVLLAHPSAAAASSPPGTTAAPVAALRRPRRPDHP